MTNDNNSIAYRDVLPLAIPPALARQYIMTPDRILDYYPGGIGGGVIESGQSIYCYNEAVISLLEIVESEANNIVTVLVTTAPVMEPPYTAERIKSSGFFSMREDWQLDETASGTQLTKTWRDVHCSDPNMEGMADIVRESAIEEAKHLVDGWNNAAISDS